MAHSLKFPPAPFGTVLGYAPGEVAIHSSHYPSVDPETHPDRESFRSLCDGVYMGYKWQCVEFARRWLYRNRGLVFEDVAMAYDIFGLRHFRRVQDHGLVPVHAFANGSPRPPEPGCLLVWEEGGEFDVTGHVAVVTTVLPDRVRIAEQNYEHSPLPAGQDWSRELVLERTGEGGYRVGSGSSASAVLGWVIQTADSRGAVLPVVPERALFNVGTAELPRHGQAATGWLDNNREDERAFVRRMGGHRLTAEEAEQYRYFRLSESAEKELMRATRELHVMFLHATQRVLNDESLLTHFNIPRALWPRLRQSWEKRRGQMITGRFDFSVSENGVKVYEYNADSASCYLETARIQGKWAAHFGCTEGRDPGEDLYEDLVDAWRRSEASQLLHIMQDNDLEETYHARFMKSAIEAAGIPCKVIRGLAGLGWNGAGEVVDPDGEPIRWVWKTWAWETALEQLRAECDAEARVPIRTGSGRLPPRLVDVLLRPEVMVFEPFWTLIPSNKAILPVLWRIFPDHPYLLNAQFEPREEMLKSGYVTKPIAGRCGDNISIFDHRDNLVKETEGRFASQHQIYQEFFPLPRVGGYNVQICTFSVMGAYGGACVRVDRSLVITNDSDLLPLRVVPDAEL